MTIFLRNYPEAVCHFLKESGAAQGGKVFHYLSSRKRAIVPFCAVLLLLVFCPAEASAQYSTTVCQQVGDATLGDDRNDFVHQPGQWINEGYLHNFTPPVLPCGVVAPNLTSVNIAINLMSINQTVACSPIPVFGNVIIEQNCTLAPVDVCGIVRDVLSPGCNGFGAGTTATGTYTLDLISCGNNIDFDDVIGVDIIPSTSAGPGCPLSNSAITDGDITVDYEICITYVYDQAESLPVAVPSFSAVCDGGGPIQLFGSTAAVGTVIDYSWTGPNGFMANGPNVPTLNPADEGVYTLVVDVDGCVSDPVNITVEYLTFAPMVAAADNSVCFGETINLSVTGDGTNFAWLDPSGNPVGGNSSTLTTTAGGVGGMQTYSVTVSDANCSELLTIDIDVFDEITGQIIVNPVGGVCAGVPTLFTAVMMDGSPFPAGWTFDWNSGDGTGPTYSFTENTPGNYTMNVTVTSPDNCSAVLSEGFVVSSTGGPPGQIMMSPAGGTCIGEPIDFTAVQSDGSPYPAGWIFDWNNGAGAGPTFQITENAVGNYTVDVTVTSPDGCSSMLSEPFSVFATPTVNITPANAVICSDGSVVLTANASGGSGNYDYLWGPEEVETGMTLTVDAGSPSTANIYVEIIDANGCSAFSSFVDVTILPDLPAVTFGACSSGSSSEITFSWNDVGQTAFELYLTVGGAAEQTISTNYTNLSYTATGLPPGTNVTLRVVPVVMSNGVTCLGQPQSQTCTTPNVACDNPGWLFTAIDPVCLTTDGQAFDLTINTTEAGTVVLNSTDLGLMNQANGPGGVTTVNLPALPGGTSSDAYTVTARFTLPDLSCPFDTTFNIPVVTPAAPEISTPLASICSAQETVRFTLVNAYDPNSTYTISVDNPSGTTIVLEDAPNQVFDISFSEFRTYQITVTTTTTGNNACSDSFTLPFTLTEPPAVPLLMCAETGLDSVAFSWTDVGGVYTVDQIAVPGAGVVEQTANGFIVRGLTSGDAVTIAVTATASGCAPVTSDTVTCVAQPCPAIVPQITTPIDTFCSDGSEMLVDLTVNVPGAGTIVWTGPGVSGTQFDPGAAGAGAHNISVEYTEGDCDYTAAIQLVVVDPPSGAVTISPDTICQGGTATVNFAGINLGNAAFEWIFPATATVLSGDITGPGPLDVSFSGLGDQTARLVITGPFCEMDTLSDNVFVATPLAAATLECVDIGLDQVGFTWTHPTATNFMVTIVSQPPGATITQMNDSLLATGLAEGESVTIEVIALSDNACPDAPPISRTCTAVSCPAVSFSIDQIGPFCVGADVTVPLTTALAGDGNAGTITFAGSSFVSAENFVSAGLMPGFYTVSAVFEEAGCSFPASIIVEITDLPDPSFTLGLGPVCTNEVVGADAGAEEVGWSYDWLVPDVSATVLQTSATTQDISWSTVGTKEVTLIVTDENGCENRLMQTIEVVGPLSPPAITCGDDSFTSVEFLWNTEARVDSFEVSINGGIAFFQDSASLVVDGLNDGEIVNIQVTALSSQACGNSLPGTENCQSESCPAIIVTPPADQTFCLGAANNEVSLMASQAGAGGTGVFTFNGPGVSENAGVFSFDPDAAGPGLHVITVVYDESICSGMATFQFTVNAAPMSDFTLNGLASDLTVCEGEVFTLAYAGDLPQASNGAFSWDFASADGGADGGYESYALSFPAAGDYTISLSLVGEGCTSNTSTLNVTVEAPLTAPVITCGVSSFTSVEFNWDALAGVDNYQVAVNGGTVFFQDSTNLFVDGLSEGQTVSIEVVAISSGVCGNSPVGTESCATDTCPLITLTPPSDGVFCNDATVPLIATQAGGEGSGEFMFSGPGVTENDGMFSFDAAVAGIGVHPITVTYDESVCSGTTTFEFTVTAPPTSLFTLNGSATNLTVCEGEVFSLAYSGDLPQANNGTFNWGFPNAIVTPDGGYESYSLSYGTAGDYVISLLVEDNDCVSEITSINVRVEAPLSAPVVSCVASTLSSVTFAWAAIPGAEGYQLGDGTLLGAGELSYTVSGLSQGEPAALSVLAVSSSSCGNGVSSAVAVCEADFEGCSTGATFTAPCNDNDPSTINDQETLLLRDSSVCIPCQGVPCDFSLSLGADFTIAVGDSVQLGLITNAPVDSVLWQEMLGLSCFNCEEPFAKPTETTSYSVIAFDENGCESRAGVTIIVDERRNIYIPNVFSPNGDGINDFFEIQGGPDIRAIHRLSIYNRWGSELFNATDQPVNSPTGRWQGDHLGQPVEPGVYIYVAVVEFTDGHLKQISGEVLVLR